MHRAPFSGITAPDPDDPITVDGASFIYRNPDLTDRLLRIGAVTHRHDAHAALQNPTGQLAVSLSPSGGTIPANTSVYAGYTLTDDQGGETTLSSVVAITTRAPLENLAPGPTASADYTAGNLVAGALQYGLTYVDGGGGETLITSPTFVTRDPGYPNAQMQLGGLAAGLGSGGVSWRLWRAVQGQPWALIAVGTSNTFTDTGLICTDPSQQPPTVNTTNSTSQLTYTLPLAVGASGDAAIASASSILLYLSTDGSFQNPCLYAAYPTASAGAAVIIPSLVLGVGAPPVLSTCVPGANRIDPDSDLVDWHWKRPVANEAALGSGATGDVRATLSDGVLWIVRGASGAAGPSDWSPLFGYGTAVDVEGLGPFADLEFVGGSGISLGVTDIGGGSGRVTIQSIVDPSGLRMLQASAANASASSPASVAFAGSGAASVGVTDLGGGSALVTITVPTITGPAGASGAPGPSGAAGGAGPTGPTGSATVAVGGSGMVPAFFQRTAISFAGSGGTGVAVRDQGGGSAQVLISAPPATSTSTGGAGTLVSAGVGSAFVSELDFAGSGAASVDLTPIPGGSAIITITVAPGPAGASGAPGPAGASGAPGPAGASAAGGAASFPASGGVGSATVTSAGMEFVGASGIVTNVTASGGSAVVTVSDTSFLPIDTLRGTLRLIHHWPMQEPAGAVQAVDVINGAILSRAGSGAAPAAAGPHGTDSAWSFDGGSLSQMTAPIKMATVASGGYAGMGLAIGMWIRFTRDTAQEILCAFMDAGVLPNGVLWDRDNTTSNQLQTYTPIGGGSNTPHGAFSGSTQGWHYFVGIVSAGAPSVQQGCYAYIDGKRVATPGSGWGTNPSAPQLQIGVAGVASVPLLGSVGAIKVGFCPPGSEDIMANALYAAR